MENKNDLSHVHTTKYILWVCKIHILLWRLESMLEKLTGWALFFLNALAVLNTKDKQKLLCLYGPAKICTWSKTKVIWMVKIDTRQHFYFFKKKPRKNWNFSNFDALWLSISKIWIICLECVQNFAGPYQRSNFDLSLKSK